MAEPTLVQVFGAGATQDANTITIQKSALVTAGLTSAASNRAEALLVAIAKLASTYLTDTLRSADSDVSVFVDTANTPSFTTRTINNVTTVYIRDTITLELDKAYSSSGIDPDDY